MFSNHRDSSCIANPILIARRYASAVYAVVVCLSVSLSVGRRRSISLFVCLLVCHKSEFYQNG